MHIAPRQVPLSQSCSSNPLQRFPITNSTRARSHVEDYSSTRPLAHRSVWYKSNDAYTALCYCLALHPPSMAYLLLGVVMPTVMFMVVGMVIVVAIKASSSHYSSGKNRSNNSNSQQSNNNYNTTDD